MGRGVDTNLGADPRGSDYLRFGLGLNVIALAVTLLLVPLLWPF